MQKTKTTPILFKCPNGNTYCPEKNVEKYQFQLKYSPLAQHTEKNPGKYCYINDTKFGEVSGCSNEIQQTNYTNSSIINKISSDGFDKRLFVYNKNYVSQPPHYNMENPLDSTRLDKLRHVDEGFLYKSYIHK